MWKSMAVFADHCMMNMKCWPVHEPSRLVFAFVLGLPAIMLLPTPSAAAGAADQPEIIGSARDADRPEVTGERPSPSGLDSTPSGGTVPGGSVPGGTVPGGTVPGGTVPGGTVPSEKLPGEDG